MFDITSASSSVRLTDLMCWPLTANVSTNIDRCYKTDIANVVEIACQYADHTHWDIVLIAITSLQTWNTDCVNNKLKHYTATYWKTLKGVDVIY